MQTFVKVPFIDREVRAGKDAPEHRLPVGSKLVPYGTPLHASEMCLQLMKASFASLPEDHPYRFANDSFEKTGVLFDVSLNKDSEIYGKKPLIVVARGGQSTTPLVIGDIAKISTMAMNHAKGSALVQGSIRISVVSKAKAEVEIISQHVFTTLMMLRTMLPALLGVHMVDALNMTEVSKFEQDDMMFQSQASVNFSMQYQWDKAFFAETLRSLSLQVVPTGYQWFRNEKTGLVDLRLRG